MKRHLLAAALLCAGALAAAAPSGQFLYRYRDAKGVLHLETSLPPQAAPGGYEVLDRKTLEVLQVVAPASAGPAASAGDAQAQAQARAQREAKEQARAAERAQRATRDRALLESYTTAADLERTRDAQLEALAAIGSGAKATVARLEENLAQMRAQRAQYEQDGRPVPKTLDGNIADVEGKLARQRALLESNARRRAELSARFEADLARYRELTANDTPAAAQAPPAPAAAPAGTP